jgi:hypothetical protein
VAIWTEDLGTMTLLLKARDITEQSRFFVHYEFNVEMNSI